MPLAPSWCVAPPSHVELPLELGLVVPLPGPHGPMLLEGAAVGLPSASCPPGRTVVASHVWRPLDFCSTVAGLLPDFVQEGAEACPELPAHKGWSQDPSPHLRSLAVGCLGTSSHQEFKQHELVPLATAWKTWPFFLFPF